jgi:hypothetical protein
MRLTMSSMRARSIIVVIGGLIVGLALVIADESPDHRRKMTAPQDEVVWRPDAALARPAANATRSGAHLATSLMRRRKMNRQQLARRSRLNDNNMRLTRSKVARSCGGEVGSVLLEQWHRHCSLVFTAAVEDIDRHSGTVNVTVRRIIRSRVDLSQWPQWKSPGESSNSLEPLSSGPELSASSEFRPHLMLHDLFRARENSCVPQFRIRSKDVLLFLAQAYPSNQSLHLVSAPLRITLRNLRLIHASPTGRRRATPSCVN